MELSDAILSRRTIKDFKPDAVPEAVLERALTAGLWAQNHRLTQPWRFTILGPETHRRLAAVFAKAQTQTLRPDEDASKRDKVRADAEGKILSKPLAVAVGQRLAGDPAQRLEDYGAISCAIQNVQLAAWSEGLGMQWSSGKIIRLDAVYDLLGIRQEEEELVGLLFFGYPLNVPAPQPRKPLSEVARRLP